MIYQPALLLTSPVERKQNETKRVQITPALLTENMAFQKEDEGRTEMIKDEAAEIMYTGLIQKEHHNNVEFRIFTER